ncbi:MAG: collagen-like protein [Dehalococcoidia bacterium]|nr:collagen-like protein [Dehalococcoidia bacterium]
MKNKLWILGLVAVLLVVGLALVGCAGSQGVAGPAGSQGVQGIQGEEGPAGPVGECSCDVADNTASLTIEDNDISGTWASQNTIVRGAGFPAGEVVTVYFAGDGEAKALKWFKVEANEVGAFRVEADFLNKTTMRDITLDVTPDDNDFLNLTVNAFVGGTLAATVEVSMK